MLPRRTFWASAGPLWVPTIWGSLDLSLQMQLRDIKDDGSTLTGRPSVVCEIKCGVTHKVSFSAFLLTGLQSDWVIEGAAGPAEGHDCHDALTSWRFIYLFIYFDDITHLCQQQFVSLEFSPLFTTAHFLQEHRECCFSMCFLTSQVMLSMELSANRWSTLWWNLPAMWKWSLSFLTCSSS